MNTAKVDPETPNLFHKQKRGVPPKRNAPKIFEINKHQKSIPSPNRIAPSKARRSLAAELRSAQSGVSLQNFSFLPSTPRFSGGPYFAAGFKVQAWSLASDINLGA
jgi:hypothetical protein